MTSTIISGHLPSLLCCSRYDIYVRYELPPTFNNFASNASIEARGDSTSNAAASMTLYLPSGSACGTDSPLFSSANTWTSTSITGMSGGTCGFNAGDIMTFKVHLQAENNANVYVSTITWTMTGK